LQTTSKEDLKTETKRIMMLLYCTYDMG